MHRTYMKFKNPLLIWFFRIDSGAGMSANMTVVKKKNKLTKIMGR